MNIIKTFCVVGLLLPQLALGASTDEEIVRFTIQMDCGTNPSNPVCNGTNNPCGNYSAGYCAALRVSGYSNKQLVCFEKYEYCNTISSCARGFSITNSGSNTVSNYVQFKCCHTCANYTDWADYSDTNYQRRLQKTCSTSGVCQNVTGQSLTMTAQYRCKAGFYNAKGTEYTTYGVAQYPNCVSCATDTGVDIATSAVGAYRKSHCYVPANTTTSDASGTYHYTDECYYTE